MTAFHLRNLHAFLTLFSLDFSMLPMGENWNVPQVASEAGLKTPVNPYIGALRRALRRNIVSFPSPSRIPVFLPQPAADMQWRMVLLYFVRGWSSVRIAARFGVPKHRIRNGLKEWSSRALAVGYVQIVDPEAFAACCQVDVEFRSPPRRDVGKIYRPLSEERPAAAAAVPVTSEECWRQAGL